MSRTTWSWELLDADEKAVDRPLSPAFTTRFDAEAWLGESWRRLAGLGVVSVRLTDRGAAVGPAIPLRSG